MGAGTREEQAIAGNRGNDEVVQKVDLAEQT